MINNLTESFNHLNINSTNIYSLPNDILNQITCYVNPIDLFKLQNVSKKFEDLVNKTWEKEIYNTLDNRLILAQSFSKNLMGSKDIKKIYDDIINEQLTRLTSILDFTKLFDSENKENDKLLKNVREKIDLMMEENTKLIAQGIAKSFASNFSFNTIKQLGYFHANFPETPTIAKVIDYLKTILFENQKEIKTKISSIVSANLI